MPVSGRTKIIAFVVLGSCLVALAVALNIGWILDWREGLLAVLGAIFFLVIITGVVLNTVFLVREVRRNEQHDTFINAVTHDLKTPVASIRLYLETLQRHDLDPQRRQEFYRIMLDDSDRLMRLVDQVLRAAKSSRHRSTQRSPVDLRALAQDCLELARTQHHLDPPQLIYRDSLPIGRGAMVMGDAEELKAAILNLIDNAVKYSSGKVAVTVEILGLDPRRVALRVHDQGIGMSARELKRIFRRFYRIPGTAGLRVKGTGLGLFIVSSIARKHGGRVFAESDGPGRGSTFTLQLPAVPAS